MKLLFTLCIFCAVQFVQAQTPVSPSAAASASLTVISGDEKSVIDTEKQRFAAQVGKEYAVLERLLANDLIYNHSNGMSDTKPFFIQSIRDGKTIYHSIDVEEQKARIYGNTAVINGLCMLKATSNGNPLTNRIRYLSVYIRNAGQWQMVAWQSLKLAN